MRKLLTLYLSLAVCALQGNDFNIAFENDGFFETSSIIERVSGSEKFIFSFTQKGDAGQFYTSPLGGANHSECLVATSSSVGSLEAEEIEIRNSSSQPFYFNGVFIRSNDEPVVVLAYFQGKQLDWTETVSSDGLGKRVTAPNLLVDKVLIKSYDFVEVAIDNFSGVSLSSPNKDLPQREKIEEPETERAPIVKSGNTNLKSYIFNHQSMVSETVKNDEVLFLLDFDRVDYLAISEGNRPVRSAFLSPFKIDIATKRLLVNDERNFSCLENPSWNLKVEFVSDGRSGVIIFDLAVAEENDLAPIIFSNQSCSAEIDDLGGLAIDLCQINMVDRDTPLKELRQWQVGEIGSECFDIVEGKLRVREFKCLQKFSQQRVDLPVRVHDGNNWSDWTTLKISWKIDIPGKDLPVKGIQGSAMVASASNKDQDAHSQENFGNKPVKSPQLSSVVSVESAVDQQATQPLKKITPKGISPKEIYPDNNRISEPLNGSAGKSIEQLDTSWLNGIILNP
ncbi:MAG: hypothetical protein ACPF8V_02130 [Luteibaculum sp.]